MGIPSITREANVLKVEEWFQEAHGIVQGSKNAHEVWIPQHAEYGRVYLWSSFLMVVGIAPEKCLKAIH